MRDLWRELMNRLPEWQRRECRAWTLAKPPVIQEMMKRHPPGQEILYQGYRCFVVGYAETTDDPGYFLTHVNPSIDYERAIASKFFVCGTCVDGEPTG